MHCKNHPETGATVRCTGCAETFCDNCVVELGGQHYCGACKVMALGDRVLVAERGTVVSSDAKSALTFSIVGLFFFGIILEPVAFFQALKARRQIAASTQLTGMGKTTATLIIACSGMALSVLNLIARIRGLE